MAAFNEKYPNDENEPLVGKIWLLINSEQSLYCLYGNKQHYTNKHYTCSPECKCVQDRLENTYMKKNRIQKSIY